jgi:sensor histidine kinase YesM
MGINIQIPRPKNLLIYSLIGSLLATIIPIMVSIDHLHDGQILFRIIDITVLFCLVVAVFYISFWINVKWYFTPKIKLLFLNLFIFFVVSIVSISIHFPIWKSTTHIPIVFFIRDEIVRNITIFIVSYLATKFYIKNLENQQMKIEFEELQKEILANQIRGLMQQINPHFFFNTLNTLSGLIQESPEKSEIFVDKFSQVFRYVLKMQENSKVRLSEELKFAEDYFYLLKMRFEDKLSLVIDVQQPSNYTVAPLCTQLLIENVIKHNRISRQFPVVIEIQIENNYLNVNNTSYPHEISNIINNNNTGFGLVNLNKRCELLFGESIIIEHSENLFCVKIPLNKN